jgi:hypothetical protein
MTALTTKLFKMTVTLQTVGIAMIFIPIGFEDEKIAS